MNESMVKSTFHVVLMLLFAAFCTPLSADEKPSLRTLFLEYEEALSLGDFKSAAEKAGLAVETAEEVLGDDDPGYIQLRFNHGQAMLYAGERKAARKSLLKTVKLQEKQFGRDAEELINSLLLLGEAKAYPGWVLPREFRRVEKLALKHFAARPLRMAHTNYSIGRSLVEMGEFMRAKKYIESSIETYRTLPFFDRSEIDRQRFWLGRIEFSFGELETARDHFLATLEGESAASLQAHAFLVRTYEELGQPDKATHHCQAIGASRPFFPDQEQSPLFMPAPKYPKNALMRMKRGYVILEYTLDEQGFVKNPKVANGDRQFGRAAKAAMQKWRFAPRFEDGEAVVTDNLKHLFYFSVQ